MPKLILKFLVSATLLAWVVHDIDIGAVARAIAKADVFLLAVACMSQFLLSSLQTLRWMLVSRVLRIDIPFRSAWANVLIGLFFNQTLPSSIGGDAVRVWRLARAGMGIGAGVAFRSVVLDRLTALVALILICLLGTSFIMGNAADGQVTYVLLAIALAGGVGISILAVADRIEWPGFSGRAARSLAIAPLAKDVRRVFGRARVAVPALLISLTIHVGVAVSGYTIAAALHVPLPFWGFVVIFLTVLLITMIPIAIAGWGLREGAMVSALAVLGVAPVDAVAISVVFGLVMIVVGAPGGILWITTRRMEAREVT